MSGYEVSDVSYVVRIGILLTSLLVLSVTGTAVVVLEDLEAASMRDAQKLEVGVEL
jgi:hypothetical protein